jgi:hypothetical protein
VHFNDRNVHSLFTDGKSDTSLPTVSERPSCIVALKPIDGTNVTMQESSQQATTSTSVQQESNVYAFDERNRLIMSAHKRKVERKSVQRLVNDQTNASITSDKPTDANGNYISHIDNKFIR